MNKGQIFVISNPWLRIYFCLKAVTGKVCLTLCLHPYELEQEHPNLKAQKTAWIALQPLKKILQPGCSFCMPRQCVSVCFCHSLMWAAAGKSSGDSVTLPYPPLLFSTVLFSLDLH